MTAELLSVICVAIASGLLGVLVTVLTIQEKLDRMLAKMPEHPSFQTINVRCEMKDADGQITMVNTLGANATGMTGKLVEVWLKERDLMMVPAGKDFAVKVKP